MLHRENQTEGLRSFFDRFQTSTARADADTLIELFAPSVMVAGPGGSTIVTTSNLAGAIAKRKHMFDEAGHRETALVGFEEIPLTSRYSLVRTDWQWVFERASGERTTITLPSSYVVERAGAATHILMYVLHDDVAAVLRQRGLLAS